MYFVVKRSKNDQFHFVLKANNHEIVCNSELYTSKAACLKTIDSIKNNLTPDTPVKDESDMA